MPGRALLAELGHVAQLEGLGQELAVAHVVGEPRPHDVALVQPGRLGVVLEEGALVEVLLHVGHLAAALLFLPLRGQVLVVLGPALVLGQVAPALNLGELAFPGLDGLALAADAFEFAEFPV